MRPAKKDEQIMIDSATIATAVFILPATATKVGLVQLSRAPRNGVWRFSVNTDEGTSATASKLPVLIPPNIITQFR